MKPRWLSSVERQPRKHYNQHSITQNIETFDWDDFREYVFKKYRPSWAKLCYCYAAKYHRLINNPSELETFSQYKKNNVLKALIALSKYLGFYREFKDRIKDYGIKWTRTSSIDSFLRILRNNNKDILTWYQKANSILDEDCSMYLKFLLLIGSRAIEGIESFNLIRTRTEGYYNTEFATLEHFKFKKIFLRGTKNLFISIIPKTLLKEIFDRNKVTYSMIKMKLQRNQLPMRLNELRDYYGTFMLRHGLLEPEINLLQGRISQSIFVRHYWSPSFKELKEKTLTALKELANLL